MSFLLPLLNPCLSQGQVSRKGEHSVSAERGSYPKPHFHPRATGGNTHQSCSFKVVSEASRPVGVKHPELLPQAGNADVPHSDASLVVGFWKTTSGNMYVPVKQKRPELLHFAVFKVKKCWKELIGNQGTGRGMAGGWNKASPLVRTHGCLFLRDVPSLLPFQRHSACAFR